MSCGLLDLKCHATGLLTGWLGEVTTWVDGVFPFGWYGVWFVAGVIVGERFGKWAYAGIAAFVVYRVMGRDKPEDHEHVDGPDAVSPLRKPKVRKPVPSKGKPSLIERLTGRPE